MKLNTFDSVYKFPEIDVVNQNNKIEFDERIIKSKQKKQKIYGSTNFKIDQQYIDQHSNSMIKSKIKSLNYEHMTINELKIYLYADMYNMIQELYYVNKLDLNQINQIINKKYRKITILILLFVFVFMIFLVINIYELFISSQ